MAHVTRPAGASSPAVPESGADRVDVVVIGLGLAGRAALARLHAYGVDARGFDPRVGWVRPAPDGAPLFDPGALGLVLPGHWEAPVRFHAAMGERGAALVAALAEHRPPLRRLGVLWRTEDVPEELRACAALGLRAEAAPGGIALLDGGEAAGDADVLVHPCPPAEGEVTLHCTGAGLGWLADKVMPVRYTSITVQAPAPQVSRAGSVYAVGGRLCGARWATPHLEVGETAAEASPACVAMLTRLAAQDGFPLADPAPRGGIVHESCDGLPIVGPLPGNPRVGVLTGLGVGGRTYLPLAVAHLVDAVLGLPDVPALPACLGTARFR